jgi:hypothetical protein
VTPDATVAADEQARAAARLRGAAEALGVLQRREPAEQHWASRFAVGLLAGHVAAADWTVAGLPRLPQQHRPARCAPDEPLVPVRVPVSDKAVLHLARAAMSLYCAELRVIDRPGHWDRLAEFYARRLPASDPALVRLRERAAGARVDAGDTSPKVFGDLRTALDFHREVDGEDAYLTALARANLAVAYRQRRSESDLAKSALLAEEEAATRTARYGPDHPVTLVARSLLAFSLILQAEASEDVAVQRRLANRALAQITKVREARDRLFGVTSPNATRSRRYEARALLLLDQPGKALSCLEYALAFENAHCAGRQTQGIGQTHYQLARVNRALGKPGKALDHAKRAHRIFAVHNPDGTAARQALALIRELSAG